MNIGQVKKFLSRSVFKRVDVKNLSSEISEAPKIFKLRSRVQTYKFEGNITADVIKPIEILNELKCKTEGFKFSHGLLHVNGGFIKRYNKYDIKINAAPKLKMSQPKNALKQIIMMPQERMNRIKWQKMRPKLAPGEMVIAWYGPIVESAVLKLVLNKQPGTLLIWYDSRSRKFSTRGLFLCRRLDSGSRPEWRWV